MDGALIVNGPEVVRTTINCTEIHTRKNFVLLIGVVYKEFSAKPEKATV